MKCLVNETPRDRWCRETDAALAPLQQRWNYGAAAGALGGSVLRIEVRDKNGTLALAQVLRRRILVPISLISRGPVWIGDPCDERRARALRLLRGVLKGPLLITPDDSADGEDLKRVGMKNLLSPSSLAVLTLDEDIRARMHGKWRNRLSAAERAGMTIRPSCNLADMLWLFEADALQQKARRYRALPPAFTKSFCRAGGNVVCLTAFQGRERLAAMLFLVHGTTATYHIGWSGGEGRAASAHNLILWHACTRLASVGVRRMDLGLIDSETAPGLARFKLGTGAVPIRTGGTWFGCW